MVPLNKCNTNIKDLRKSRELFSRNYDFFGLTKMRYIQDTGSIIFTPEVT